MDQFDTEDLKDYEKDYSEESLFKKFMSAAKKAGIKVVYAALLLYYTLKKPTTPNWAKGTILGALGYFISPIDVIPDFIPLAGFSDDLGALVLAIGAVAIFIDDEVKQQAKAKLRDWFGEYDGKMLTDIDDKLK